MKGKSAAEALNSSFTYGGRAGKGTAQTSQALLGEQSGDLRRLVDSSGRVFAKLASREAQLSSLISNFSITAGAFAAESAALEETLARARPDPRAGGAVAGEVQRGAAAATRLLAGVYSGRRAAAGDDPRRHPMAQASPPARPA